MAGFKKTKLQPPAKVSSYSDIDTALEAVASAIGAHGDELSKLNGGIELGANTVGLLKKLSFKMPDLPPWRSGIITPVAGQTGEIQALMSPGGVVELKGTLQAGAGAYAGGIANGSPIGTLPVGYRPYAAQALAGGAAVVGAAIGWVVVSITTAGAMNYSGIAGAATPLYIDGVRFYATAAAAPHQFVGAGWPIIVEHGLQRARGLVALGCRLSGQSGQNAGVGTPQVDWQDLGDGRLRVNGVWGLQWGQRYDLQVYISPEEAS